MRLQSRKIWPSLWFKVNQQAQAGRELPPCERNRSKLFQLILNSTFFTCPFSSSQHKTAGRKAGSKSITASTFPQFKSFQQFSFHGTSHDEKGKKEGIFVVLSGDGECVQRGILIQCPLSQYLSVSQVVICTALIPSFPCPKCYLSM